VQREKKIDSLRFIESRSRRGAGELPRKKCAEFESNHPNVAINFRQLLSIDFLRSAFSNETSCFKTRGRASAWSATHRICFGGIIHFDKDAKSSCADKFFLLLDPDSDGKSRLHIERRKPN
jgi:hypothetical protein